MGEDVLAAKRAYNREQQRKWREKNKEKAREYQRQYKKDNAERIKQHQENFYKRLAEQGGTEND